MWLGLKLAVVGVNIIVALAEYHHAMAKPPQPKERIQEITLPASGQKVIADCIYPPKGTFQPRECKTVQGLIHDMAFNMAYYQVPKHSDGGQPDPTVAYFAKNTADAAMHDAVVLEKIFKKSPAAIPKDEVFNRLADPIASPSPAYLAALKEIQTAIREKRPLQAVVARWFNQGGYQPKPTIPLYPSP